MNNSIEEYEDYLYQDLNESVEASLAESDHQSELEELALAHLNYIDTTDLFEDPESTRVRASDTETVPHEQNPIPENENDTPPSEEKPFIISLEQLTASKPVESKPLFSLEELDAMHPDDRKPSIRYFTDPSETVKQIICKFCRQPGHILRECKAKEIRCHLCRSDHDPLRCPLQEICFRCYRRGHQRVQCQEHDFDRYCTYCDSESHPTMDCDRVWRRYIYKRSKESNRSREKEKQVLAYCYHCGTAGHFGDDCPDRSSMRPTAFNDEAARPRHSSPKSSSGKKRSSYGNSSSRGDRYEPYASPRPNTTYGEPYGRGLSFPTASYNALMAGNAVAQSPSHIRFPGQSPALPSPTTSFQSNQHYKPRYSGGYSNR